MEKGKGTTENGVVASIILLATFLSFTGETRSLEEEWIGKTAPEIAEGQWINSAPLKLSELRGKVVLLEFWTYGCYNCRNTLPFLKDWYRQFPRDTFEMIGVHSPEFEREKIFRDVERETRKLGIEYPVVTDNEFSTWRSYNQRYWPVIYLIDKQGIICYVQIGEGAYERTEKEIRMLIDE